MISFLPISILGYVLNGGTTLIDKVLLQKSLPHPVVYTFYISIVGLSTLLLIPLGIKLSPQIILFGTIAGITGYAAQMCYFESLKQGEASVVNPIIGSLNPLLTLVLGALLLNQTLTHHQILSFFILLFGAIILTLDHIFKVRFNKQLLIMTLSGFAFAVSYLFLREAFLASNFLTGLIITRVAGGIFALFFLIPKNTRNQIISSKLTKNHFENKTSYLMFAGQGMGAVGGLLITYGVSLANPALVNSLFGVQYLVILIVALILYKRHSHILGEHLSQPILIQKFLGIIILSFGLYLLT